MSQAACGGAEATGKIGRWSPRDKRVVGEKKWKEGHVCNNLFLLCGLKPGCPSQKPEFPLVWSNMKKPKDLGQAESQLNDNICYEFFAEL